MQSKHKRYIVAPILFIIFIFVFSIALGFAMGVGIEVGGTSSVGALYFIGGAVLISPLLYLFTKELVVWTRNYHEQKDDTQQVPRTQAQNEVAADTADH